MNNTKTKKHFPWRNLLIFSLLILVIGGLGFGITILQIASHDVFAMSQGSGALSPEELASAIRAKREPQIFLFFAISLTATVSVVVSIIGLVASRKRA